MNAIRHQLDAIQSSQTQPKKRGGSSSIPPASSLTPSDTAYWARGRGEGGDKPWRFNCKCGEMCSSYENFRYHPIGRMFECTRCNVWSHVECVLGVLSDEDIEEIQVCSFFRLFFQLSVFFASLAFYSCSFFSLVIVIISCCAGRAVLQMSHASSSPEVG